MNKLRLSLNLGQGKEQFLIQMVWYSCSSRINDLGLLWSVFPVQVLCLIDCYGCLSSLLIGMRKRKANGQHQ